MPWKNIKFRILGMESSVFMEMEKCPPHVEAKYERPLVNIKVERDKWLASSLFRQVKHVKITR